MNCQWTRQVSELAIRLIQAIHGMAVAVFILEALAVIRGDDCRPCRLENVCSGDCNQMLDYQNANWMWREQRLLPDRVCMASLSPIPHRGE